MKPQLPPAVILAGGLGTRLRPLISDRPKALAVVAGKPFILYQLEWLRRNLVQSVILCVGYKGEQIVDYLGDGSRLGLRCLQLGNHTFGHWRRGQACTFCLRSS